MKISILCCNLSNNAMGRSYLLAKILQRRFHVEIVGPVFGRSIWPALADRRDVPIKPVYFDHPPHSYRQIGELLDLMNGDVLYANKTFFSSFGLALLKKFRYKKTVVLDIDDWDLGFALYKLSRQSPKGLIKTFGRWFLELPRFYQSDKICSLYCFEKLAVFADAITVSNTFLQKKFGGTLIPHVRDADIFNPALFDSQALRAELGIDHRLKIAGFIGTPRAFKGVEDLLEAAVRTSRQDLAVMVVGMDVEDAYCQKIERVGRRLLGPRFISFGPQFFESLPKFLAVCDVVVIPQRKTLATKGQIPAKLFDAMAMAKPIVATDVNDIGQILTGCGRVVSPGDIEQIAEAISFYLSDPRQAEQTGRLARQKCVEKYSLNSAQPVLTDVFGRFEK